MSDAKKKYHKIVERHGSSFTQNFISCQTTHLNVNVVILSNFEMYYFLYIRVTSVRLNQCDLHNVQHGLLQKNIFGYVNFY